MGVASGSGWNLWVWLAGSGCWWNLWVWQVCMVVRRYIDFPIILIPTSLFFAAVSLILFFVLFFVLVKRKVNRDGHNTILDMY